MGRHALLASGLSPSRTRARRVPRMTPRAWGKERNRAHGLVALLQGLFPLFPGVRNLCSQEQCLQHTGQGRGRRCPLNSDSLGPARAMWEGGLEPHWATCSF